MAHHNRCDGLDNDQVSAQAGHVGHVGTLVILNVIKHGQG